jgi:Fe-S oxidoreductase
MALDKGLFSQYEKCLQDEPAATTARCPVHVDVAKLCAAVAAGNFTQAYQELQKRIPFAGMFALVCDHPCESACVRRELDEPVRLGMVERAAVTYGYVAFKKKFKTSRKSGSVAVVGGGISGLSAAFDLERRGFEVTLYESTDKLGGWIWQMLGAGIELTDIQRSIAEIKELAITVRLNEHISIAQLEQLQQQYLAVYLGTGTWQTALAVDSLTLRVGSGNLFAGGAVAGIGESLIAAVSSGKRAAVSMERLIKGASLTAERERETSFTTLLQYDMTGVGTKPAQVTQSATFSKEQAQTEAARCLRCECDACLKACAHMRRYGRRPKTYAREIYTNENVFLGTRYANKMINSCTLCGLCGVRCPLNLSMAPLVAQTRRSMVAAEKMPPSAHDFALREMAFANSDSCALLRLPPSSATDCQTASASPQYLFYPGCQLAASAPEHVESAYAWLLEKLPNSVGLMLGCCGAPANWAGRDDLLAESIANLRQSWESIGKPTLILACSSCKDVFSKQLPELPTVSLWQMIDTLGLPAAQAAVPAGTAITLCVHDACSARDDIATQDSVRSIATRLGYELVETFYSRKNARCCGYGGLVYYANREQAQDFASDFDDSFASDFGAALPLVADNTANDEQSDMLVYCAMCKDLYVQGNRRCLHLLDLLFAAQPGELALRASPSLSTKEENRKALRQRMLARFWGEESEPVTANVRGYELLMAAGVQELMEERLILLSDVADVLTAAIYEDAPCFYHPEKGSYLASLRKQFVTYWVEYYRRERLIEVIGLYSHRMKLV